MLKLSVNSRAAATHRLMCFVGIAGVTSSYHITQRGHSTHTDLIAYGKPAQKQFRWSLLKLYNVVLLFGPSFTVQVQELRPIITDSVWYTHSFYAIGDQCPVQWSCSPHTQHFHVAFAFTGGAKGAWGYITHFLKIWVLQFVQICIEIVRVGGRNWERDRKSTKKRLKSASKPFNTAGNHLSKFNFFSGEGRARG